MRTPRSLFGTKTAQIITEVPGQSESRYGEIIMGRQDGKNYKPIQIPDTTDAENAVILELQDSVSRLKDEISALKAENQKLNGQISKMKTVFRNISSMTEDMLRTM